MVDFKKLLEIGKYPLIALIVLDIIKLLLIKVPSTWYLTMIIGLIGWAIILYAGYITTKIHKMGVINAAIVGLLISLIDSIIVSIFYIIFSLVGDSGNPAIQATDFLDLVLVLIINLILSSIIGFILSLIGGIIGEKF